MTRKNITVTYKLSTNLSTNFIKHIFFNVKYNTQKIYLKNKLQVHSLLFF